MGLMSFALLFTLIVTAGLQTVFSSRLHKPGWEALLETDEAAAEANPAGNSETHAQAANESQAAFKKTAKNTVEGDDAYSVASLAAWDTARQKAQVALPVAQEAMNKFVAADAIAKAKRKDKKAKQAAEAAKREATEAQEKLLAALEALKFAAKTAAKAHPEAAAVAAKVADDEAIKVAAKSKAATAEADKGSSSSTYYALLEMDEAAEESHPTDNSGTAAQATNQSEAHPTGSSERAKRKRPIPTIPRIPKQAANKSEASLLAAWHTAEQEAEAALATAEAAPKKTAKQYAVRQIGPVSLAAWDAARQNAEAALAAAEEAQQKLVAAEATAKAKRKDKKAKHAAEAAKKEAMEAQEELLAATVFFDLVTKAAAATHPEAAAQASKDAEDEAIKALAENKAAAAEAAKGKQLDRWPYIYSKKTRRG